MQEVGKLGRRAGCAAESRGRRSRLRFGARHRGSRIVRWLFQPGIWVQKITTKQPTDDMIEVAIVSLEQALLADGEELPDGGIRIGRSPMTFSAEARPATEA